jgi:hypothetical protein
MKKLILPLCFLFISALQAQTWNLAGNSSIVSTNFIGTTSTGSYFDINFKRQGITAGFIGTSNTAYGINTSNSMNTGSYNSAFGVDALKTNTTGTYNSAFGLEALKNNTTGTYNTAIGVGAYSNNKTGNYNLAIGAVALIFNPFYTNTNNGSNNIGIGFGTGLGLTSGSNNIFIGINAGNVQSTGSGNVIIGSSVSLSNSTNNIVLADGTGQKCLWVNSNGIDLLSAGSWIPRIRIKTDGKVIIGDPGVINTTPGSYKLYVEQGILTEKVKVALESTSDWSDFVFASDYKLLSLDSVESYINDNCHLPGVPSADDVVKEGIDVAKMDALLLQKIEELTLYVIELKKEIEVLKVKQ